MKADLQQYTILRRRTVLLWSAVAVLVGGLLIVIVQAQLNAYIQTVQQLAERDSEAAARDAVRVFRLVFGALAALIGALGPVLIWYGCRALRSGYFPPPGAWIIEGQEVFIEQKARTAAWAIIVIGCAFLVIAGGILYYSWRLLDTIFPSM